MMRFGKRLGSLDADIEFIPSASGSSSEEFDKEYAEAEE